MNPIIKWAGGKRQLLPEINRLKPDNYNHYFEPFVGGGAVLFDLAPLPATINDLNKFLVGVYEQVRDNPNELMALIDTYDSGIKQAPSPKEFYYQTRDKFNEYLASGDNGLEASALLIFINKHCFNGLYRVNRKGLFNVPYNTSTQSSYSKENILEVSDYLKSVEIKCGDFEDAVTDAKAGDFVFFDSPYAPLNPTSFESYTKEGFEEEEHRRLAKLFKTLSDKGCLCMLTNHDTELIRELYGDYKLEVVQVRRAINSDASKRTGTEVIVRNY